ncbi:glycoside hydrolase family 97 protein [Sphingomonas sp. R647]|uniref:glycoside hydrolase family 97 protein n=1 Tax=Sphingomonas sp. R647 TaxID=2875233 RepID=UPI001CD2EAEC|nr:glycoside hydrolase family 97 protein [Sphingomonas sp. R647]MCA1199848.1 glycoside hydrolase family 97 protein [Sphingomonas sp. R647]
MRGTLALTALTLPLLALASPALAQDVAQATTAKAGGATAASPDGSIRVTVTTDGDGRPYYSVTRNGKPLIQPSRMGFMLGDAPKLERGFAILSQSVTSADSTWAQPWGEWQSVRDRHTQLRVRLKETTALGRVMDVVFRVFDDGFGFRYELPAPADGKPTRIIEELTEFSLASDGTAWWTPAGEWNRYEYPYNKTPVSSMTQAHTPVTMKLADGTHVAFHEAALVDYAAMWLRRVEGTRFRAALSPSSQGAAVIRDGAFTTPWRTLRVADSAAKLYMSQLELNLNEPNKLGDVSWFKPSKYVGVWWEMHLDAATWGTGARLGAKTENVKRYIDFAAQNGFRGVLVEGWNVGWDGNWFDNGDGWDFDKPVAQFDMAALAAYAKKKGVHIVGHHETGGGAGQYEAQSDDAYRYAAANGIEVVKTGYVTDAGQIDRVWADGRMTQEWHDGQYMSRHHLNIVRTAAKYKVAVNPHEPIKDTGLRRTYPNWVSREGARGQEYNAWGEPKNPPEHEANLFFTRMLAGPFDFTPGVLSLTGKGGTPFMSTLSKQLAQYIVLYSPIQMAADLPENYAKHPGAFQFIKDVAVDWTDTRVLNGEVGEFVTVVRKAKGTGEWFLGAVTDGTARTTTLKLDFLDPGKSYEAQIYRDGEGADYRTDKRHAIVIEKKRVKAGDTLSLWMGPGGGAAVRFVAR